MSIKLISHVLDNVVLPSSEKLVLVCLADWANDEGGSLYPSLDHIAHKANLGERHTRRIMDKFKKDGIVTVVGKSRYRTNEYRLNVYAAPLLPKWVPQMSPTVITKEVNGNGRADISAPIEDISNIGADISAIREDTQTPLSVSIKPSVYNRQIKPSVAKNEKFVDTELEKAKIELEAILDKRREHTDDWLKGLAIDAKL